MRISIDVEDARWDALPDANMLIHRALHATNPDDDRSVDVLLTGDLEIRTLNREWLGKDKSTNVLSFPSPEMPVPPGEVAHLGDVVLAWDTVEREALTAAKPLGDHVVHLAVHAMLHLLGFDHENDAEGDVMEAKEIEILAGLDIADPYAA